MFSSLRYQSIRSYRCYLTPFERKAITDVLKPPVRPANSFATFFKDQYSSVIKEIEEEIKNGDLPKVPEGVNPNIYTTAFATRKVAEKWKVLPKKEKDEYSAKYQELNEHFKKENERFLKGLTENQQAIYAMLKSDLRNAGNKEVRRARLSPEVNAIFERYPTRPVSNGYNYFIKEYCSLHPITDATKEQSNSRFVDATNAWKQLSDDKKKEYDAKAKATEKKYLQELKEFLRK